MENYEKEIITIESEEFFNNASYEADLSKYNNNKKTKVRKRRRRNKKAKRETSVDFIMGNMLFKLSKKRNDLYDSMQLRGFDGDFHTGKKAKLKSADFLWPVLWGVVIAALRLFPVVEMLGSLFVH